jgi:serine/threonine protein kinase
VPLVAAPPALVPPMRVLDYREAELGPALVFEHDPNAPRLDRYLGQRLADLALDQRLALIRQLGEAMAYAHGKRIYHRGLAPQSILVRDPDAATPRLQIMNWQVASRPRPAIASCRRRTKARRFALRLASGKGLSVISWRPSVVQVQL